MGQWYGRKSISKGESCVRRKRLAGLLPKVVVNVLECFLKKTVFVDWKPPEKTEIHKKKNFISESWKVCSCSCVQLRKGEESAA